jgi:hypothetical protein
VFFDFVLCSSFAFRIASRTAIEDPALVVLTAVGVVLGLAVTGAVRRGELGVGVDARSEERGVFDGDLVGLNVECV